MNTRPKIPANARNLNACVIGSSGSGKTRFWLTPQLLQAHSSYVCVDPKGGTLDQCGRFLQRQGYKVRVFNSIDFSKSMHYNPLAYIKTESDVLKFVNALIANTKGDGKEGDEFWTKAETLLYCALVAYIVFEGPEEERNMNTLVEMINSMEVREDDETFKNAVDYMFDGLERRSPQHFAVRQYKKYKLASGKTAKSILISCGARLAPFDIPQLREIMSYDELELDRLGDEKSALFFLISDTDTTYNFLVALAFSQMFNLLCERADNKYGGRLPHHVRVLWDEAANTGQVPGLEKIVAVIRSREISLTLFYQAMSQCKALYKDNSETIMGNLDGLFNNVNEQVGEIAVQVGKTPADWNAGVFSMIRQLSETVVLPIAGIILTFVATYELIQMLIDRNNLHDVDTWMFFKWTFKTFVAVMILANTFNIALAVFDVSQHVIQQSAGIIQNGTEITPDVMDSLRTELEAMDVGPLLGLWLQSFLVQLTMIALNIVIFVIVYGRMIEIYLLTSLAPIPFATVSNRETGHVGQNYFRSLFAVGFQGFLIMVCIAIYAVLIQSIAVDGDPMGAIWGCVGYTVLLCFTLFKTGSLSKSIFGAH